MSSSQLPTLQQLTLLDIDLSGLTDSERIALRNRLNLWYQTGLLLPPSEIDENDNLVRHPYKGRVYTLRCLYRGNGRYWYLYGKRKDGGRSPLYVGSVLDFDKVNRMIDSHLERSKIH